MMVVVNARWAVIEMVLGCYGDLGVDFCNPGE